jgi:hypothetical protein
MRNIASATSFMKQFQQFANSSAVLAEEDAVRLALAGLHCGFDLQALHIPRNRCDRKSASCALVRHCTIPAR